ncbi:MAG: TIM barrel protein [Christensenellales bacterium]
MLRIGPSGNSLSFYESGHKHTFEAAKWLAAMGLNAYEYSFGRGVKMSDETAAKIRSEMDKYGIEVSVHAPYYTNFSNPDPK